MVAKNLKENEPVVCTGMNHELNVRAFYFDRYV